MKWSWLLLVGLLCTIVFNTTHATSLQEYAEKPFGRVLMLRHALAPGFGDPSNFQLRDCSTQRILDEVGREQSRQIGNAFRKAGLRFEGVYSSQWCRCLDTAELLDIGTVDDFTGLNSFYTMPEREAEWLAELREHITLLGRRTDEPVIMVTHAVTISAIAGVSVGSGEAVLLDLNGTAEPTFAERLIVR